MPESEQPLTAWRAVVQSRIRKPRRTSTAGLSNRLITSAAFNLSKRTLFSDFEIDPGTFED